MINLRQVRAKLYRLLALTCSASALNRTLLVVAGLALALFVDRAQPTYLLGLLYHEWPAWTWWLNVSLRVVAGQLVAVLLWRRMGDSPRDLLVVAGLGALALVLFLEAASARYEEKPLQLQGFLLNSGIALIALKKVRAGRQRLRTKPDGQGEKNDQHSHVHIVRGPR